MSRDQLARVFPDGKTLHLPADGRPLSGYALAAAEQTRRSQNAGDAPPETGIKQFFSSLFGTKFEQDDDESESARPSSRSLPTATFVQNAPAPGAPAPAAKPATGAGKSMALAGLQQAPLPKAPPMQWNSGPQGVQLVSTDAGSPLPRPRPAEVAAKPAIRTASLETTASLPAMFDRPSQPAGPALAYAPADDPRVSAAAIRADPQLRARLGRAIERPDRPHADAAEPPASLLGQPMMQYVAELHQPEIGGLLNLVAPARHVVAAQFGFDAPTAPATARFSGPAVAPLPIRALDRSAGLAGGLTSGI
jgi:hypothetical protein